MVLAPPINLKLMSIFETACAEHEGVDPASEEKVPYWKCNFCGAANRAEMMDEGEVPKEKCVDYMIDPPPTVEEGEAYNNVVFCIGASTHPQIRGNWSNAERA